MRKAHCTRCYRSFSEFSEKDTATTIRACPFCSNEWRVAEVAGIKWEVFPELLKTVERYLCTLENIKEAIK